MNKEWILTIVVGTVIALVIAGISSMLHSEEIENFRIDVLSTINSMIEEIERNQELKREPSIAINIPNLRDSIVEGNIVKGYDIGINAPNGSGNLIRGNIFEINDQEKLAIILKSLNSTLVDYPNDKISLRENLDQLNTEFGDYPFFASLAENITKAFL